MPGRAPGVMQAYAPEGKADAEDGFVESEETVKRLAKWRGEAIY